MIHKVVGFTFLFFVTACGTEPVSILNSQQSIQVVNGIAIPESEFPAVVQINQAMGGGTAACTATFVSPSTIITAAHCVEGSSPVKVATGPAAGATSKKILRHPSYTSSGVMFDVAVLIFKENTSEEFIEVSSRAPDVGDGIEIVGYGYSQFNTPASGGTKRKGTNFVTANGERISFKHKKGLATTDGTNACNAQGDSGGPILLNGNIIGVSSTIATSGNEVVGNYPNLLHEKHLPFLKTAVTQHGADIRGL